MRSCKLIAHPLGSAEGGACIRSLAGKLFFDAQQLVVLGEAFRSTGGSRLDLAGAQTHGQVRDVVVLRLT